MLNPFIKVFGYGLAITKNLYSICTAVHIGGGMISGKRMGLMLLIVAGIIVGVGYFIQTQHQKHEALTVSTTTSLYDTGLLEDAIAPAFREKTGIELRFIPKGTGAAILDARQGVADAIMVHARSKELRFMKDGYGVDRKVFAYNFFLIVGPEDDPAGIRGLPPAEALEKIASAGKAGKARWVSRDDGSGTNTKEIQLWKKAGYNYSEIKDEQWFVSTGSGMGNTLRYTSSVRGYTLTDRGTYLKFKKDGLIDLVPLVDRGEELINVYSIIIVNPEKFKKDFNGAIKLEKWLISEEGQRIIGDFGKDTYGEPLFYPAIGVLESGRGDTVKWIVKYGFMEDNGIYTECPRDFRMNAGELTFFEFPENFVSTGK